MQTKLRYPWFKFFPNDWLAQSHLYQLNVTSEGCFLRLICHCWAHGNIPRARDRLEAICGHSGPDLDAAIRLFTPKGSDTSKLYHPGLESIREAAIKKHNERVSAGRRGARKRWKPTEEDSDVPPVKVFK